MVDVQIQQLVKRYAGNTAIDHIDLAIPAGAFVTLLGPSGCGKTTTLRSIAGLEHPDEGTILVGDRTLFDGERRVFVPPEKRNLGMVFQSYALWPHMTVAQNVAYPLKRQGWGRAAIVEEVDRLLAMVNLAAQKERSVAALSGGQQQRVALARAMVGNPAMTLFDEPLSNLDVKLRDRMRTEIRRLHDRIGMTSVYVTHDQKEAFALSDLVVVMNDGRIQQAGTPQDVYHRPANAFVADFVGFENRFSAIVVSGQEGRLRLRFPSGAELEMSGVEARVGETVSVFGRSEHVHLGQAPGLTEVTTGVVRDSTYFGNVYEFHVETELGEFRAQEAVRDGQNAPFSIGDRVPVSLEAGFAACLSVSPGTPNPLADS